MSDNISNQEQHQKKFKRENTSPPSMEPSRMEHYYMTPSIEQLNLAEMEKKPMPSSLSTKSTSKQASTPGPLCSISPTPYYKPRNRLCWSNQVPRRRNLLPEINHYYFFQSPIHQYVHSRNVVRRVWIPSQNAQSYMERSCSQMKTCQKPRPQHMATRPVPDNKKPRQ